MTAPSSPVGAVVYFAGVARRTRCPPPTRSEPGRGPGPPDVSSFHEMVSSLVNISQSAKGKIQYRVQGHAAPGCLRRHVLESPENARPKPPSEVARTTRRVACGIIFPPGRGVAARRDPIKTIPGEPAMATPKQGPNVNGASPRARPGGWRAVASPPPAGGTQPAGTQSEQFEESGQWQHQTRSRSLPAPAAA